MGRTLKHANKMINQKMKDAVMTSKQVT